MDTAAATQHTFLFADLVGFTAFTERVGDEAAADVAVAFQTTTAHLAADYGCEVVKSLGDAVMVHGEDAVQVFALALRMRGRAVARGLVPAAAYGRALRERPCAGAAIGTARRSTSPRDWPRRRRPERCC